MGVLPGSVFVFVFKPTSGLRQIDPLSPFSYLSLAMGAFFTKFDHQEPISGMSLKASIRISRGGSIFHPCPFLRDDHSLFVEAKDSKSLHYLKRASRLPRLIDRKQTVNKVKSSLSCCKQTPTELFLKFSKIYTTFNIYLNNKRDVCLL